MNPAACQEYGASEAWGTVWRGALLGAALGGVLYATYYVDEPYWTGVGHTTGIGMALAGLWAAGSGLIAASRAPRGSVENDAAMVHAVTGFFSGVGGGTATLAVTLGMRRPRRRRRALAGGRK